jgi:hypothetical protein
MQEIARKDAPLGAFYRHSYELNYNHGNKLDNGKSEQKNEASVGLVNLERLKHSEDKQNGKTVSCRIFYNIVYRIFHLNLFYGIFRDTKIRFFYLSAKTTAQFITKHHRISQKLAQLHDSAYFCRKINIQWQ